MGFYAGAFREFVKHDNADRVRLGLADPNEVFDTQLEAPGQKWWNTESVRVNRRYSTDELATNLAKMKIYHPKDFDQRMSLVDSEIKRRYVPASGGKKGGSPAQDNGAFIRDAYNKAFKSRTYLDAMKNYELRQQFPDRYIPAGFESLQNLDMYTERGQALQRRGILGRRRIQSLGGEQANQQATT